MENRYFGIYSKNILILDRLSPVHGIVVIKDEIIEKIIEIPPDAEVELENFQLENFRVFDFQDEYVAPGLVEMNAVFSSDCESYKSATMAAVSGGITLLLDYQTANSDHTQVLPNEHLS